MSKTVMGAAEVVYEHLSGGPLEQAVSGGLYLYQRPPGSEQEDIVVNAIGMNNRPIQRGILNVNVFVPNLHVRNASKLDYSIPDTKRLSELALLGQAELGETWGEGWNFVEQQHNVMMDKADQHFINFRVEFRALNFQSIIN